MTYPTTVTADDGTAFTVPPPPVVAAYAVAMYGEGHGPLDDGTEEAHDALVTIAAQAALDAERGEDPHGVRATRTCQSTRYTAGGCLGGPTYDVVYRTSNGVEQDRHAACFRHGMAEVDRHHASAGMARCDLEAQPVSPREVHGG